MKFFVEIEHSELTIRWQDLEARRSCLNSQYCPDRGSSVSIVRFEFRNALNL